jgi:hypothetical protein
VTAPQPVGDESVIIARRCWLDLQAQRRRRQIPLRKLATELRRRFPQDAPAHTTLQDWLVNRKSLPDKPLFLAFVGLLELDEKNWAERWEQWDRARLALPTTNGDQAEAAAPTRHLATVMAEDEPHPAERRRRISIDLQPQVLVGAAVVLVAAVGVGGVFLPTYGSGADVISAVAANRAAHADFHRDEARILVFDDLIDGRSAILQMRIDGSDVETLYNAKGVTGAKHPPKIVDVPGLVDDTAVAFRVCAGEYGNPVPEETCGAWTTDESG